MWESYATGGESAPGAEVADERCRGGVLTSYGEGAVVSPVNDEAVHAQRDGRGLRVGRVVARAVVLQRKEAHVCPHQLHSAVTHPRRNPRGKKTSFYAIKHSVQIQIPIRPRWKTLDLVMEAAAVSYGLHYCNATNILLKSRSCCGTITSG